MIGLRSLLVLGLAGGMLAQCGPKPAPPPPVVLPAAPVKVGPEIGLTATPVPLNATDATQTAVGRFVYAGGLHVTSADTSRLHGLSDVLARISQHASGEWSLSVDPLLEGLGLADLVVRLRSDQEHSGWGAEAGELDFF